MKKLILLLSTILIFGCSGSDNNSSNSNLLGKWTPEIETDYKSTGEVYNQSLYSDEPCYQMTTFEYKSNGQLTKKSFDYNTTCIQNPTRIYTYNVSGNILTINADGDKTVFSITENTNSVLKIKQTYEDNSYTITEYSKVN